MRVTIQNVVSDSTNSCTVESSSVTATEVLQDCIQAMLGSGFHPNSVKEAILEKAEEYEEAN